MNRRMMWLSVLALGITMLATDVVDAQQKGRERGKRGQGQRRPGGFGGFGGFGGADFSRGPMTLLGSSGVQKELGLSEEQIAEANKLRDAYREESRSGGGRFDFRALRDLPEEERNAKIAEFRKQRKQREETQKKLNAKYDLKIAELLDPAQADRLDQITLQLKGAAALLEPGIAKTLGINKEQQDKIASINEKYTAQRNELFQGFRGGGNREGFREAFAKMRELGEKRDANVLAVLSSDQKKKFDEMKGKPIDRQSLFSGFGRGGDRGKGGKSKGRSGKRGKRPAM